MVSLKAPGVAESLTLSVVITSSYQGTNRSDNLSYTIEIVQPFILTATLVAATGVTVGPLLLTVTLDGAPVGTIHVPVITAGSTYPLSFSYVDLNLSAGWHTFAISLSSEHGLVTFSGGAQQYSDTFYVTGPPPDYTIWYTTGPSPSSERSLYGRPGWPRAGADAPRSETVATTPTSISDLRCTSCGRPVSVRGATHFLCPSCGQATLGRCAQCRDQSVVYHCPNCGFEGP